MGYGFVDEVRETEGNKDNPAYLAEKYSRLGRRFLLAVIACASVFVFLMLIMSFFPNEHNDTLFLVITTTATACTIFLMIIPLVAIGYYAQADFYRSLTDGRNRLVRWRNYSFLAFGFFLGFLLLGMFIHSLGTVFFVLPAASFLATIYIGAGYLTYSSEKGANERRVQLTLKLESQNLRNVEMVYAILASESVAVLFAIVLFAGITPQNFLVGIGCLAVALVLLYHMVWTYRRHAPELREVNRANREIMLRSYLEEQKEESPRIRRIKKGINAVVMALNYLLWLSLLYEIKIQSLPVNCDGAWPMDSIFYFLAFMLLIGIVLFTTAIRNNRGVSSLIMIYITLFLVFVLQNMVIGCPCWDSSIITKTYIQAAAVFIMDTAFKAAMVTGLLKDWARKYAEKMLARQP